MPEIHKTGKEFPAPTPIIFVPEPVQLTDNWAGLGLGEDLRIMPVLPVHPYQGCHQVLSAILIPINVQEAPPET
jgi:hypothetical protein